VRGDKGEKIGIFSDTFLSLEIVKEFKSSSSSLLLLLLPLYYWQFISICYIC